jgi:toxin ParE1/3/4
MTRVIISPRADADVDDILRYLGRRGGLTLVQSYLNRFEDVYSRLAEFPGTGAARTKFGPAARIVTVAPYVIIYDWDTSADTVTVLRIIRGSCRITRKVVYG